VLVSEQTAHAGVDETRRPSEDAALADADPAVKKRGRPPASTGAARGSARTRIIHAAEHEFAERGYEAASLRAVARRAGVDPALVHHYFDDKADLFTATIKAPVRPDRLITTTLAGPRDEVGASIVRLLFEQLGAPQARRRVVMLLRTALGTGPASRILKEFLVREVFFRIASSIGGDDAELRAGLAASQVVGLIIARYVLAIEPLASASVDELVERVGPVIQWHLVGFPTIVATRSTTLDGAGSSGE
jgi:AcrR family transcriptional regulator